MSIITDGQTNFEPLKQWEELSATNVVESIRLKALKGEPFMAGKGFDMKIFIARRLPSGAPLKTMATDGKNIYVNPEYLIELMTKQKVFVFLHELLHVVLGHCLRRGWRDQQKWNIACDHEVNNLLIDNGYSMPEHGICDRKYQNWHAERIYADLYGSKEKEQEKDNEGEGKPGKQGDGEGQIGEPCEASEPTGDPCEEGDPGQGNAGDPSEQGKGSGVNDEKESLAGEVMDVVNDDGTGMTEEQRENALNKVRLENEYGRVSEIVAGKSGGIGTSVSVERLRHPRPKFKSVFPKWFNKNGVTRGTTWKRLNRRHLACDIYSPGKQKKGSNWMVYAVDASGSMDLDALRRVNEEMEACRTITPVRRITLLPFNSRILNSRVVELGPADKIPNSMHASGGTSFSPVFDWVREQEGKPDGIIIFTDMGSCDYGEPVDGVPLIWVSSEPLYRYTYGTDSEMTNIPPFGDAVEIGDE